MRKPAATPRRRRRWPAAVVALVFLAWIVALILAVRRVPSPPAGGAPILGVAAGERDEDAAAEALTSPRPTPPAAEEGVLPARRTDVVYFLPESAALSERARRLLDDVLRLLRRHPEYRLFIEGHCALFGTAQGRLALSLRRARVVEGYLYEGGWAPETAPRVEGAGGYRPATRAPERQHLNRRVEVSITFRASLQERPPIP